MKQAYCIIFVDYLLINSIIISNNKKKETMTIALGKHFSHLGTDLVDSLNNNDKGYFYCIKTKTDVFYAYMGELGLEDFYKIIPESIIYKYEYECEQDNLKTNICFDLSEYGTFHELVQKEERNQVYIMKMTVGEFKRERWGVDLNAERIPLGRAYSIFNMSAELKNLDEDKQLYLLNENYNLAKSSLGKMKTSEYYVFACKCYMPSNLYSFEMFLQTMGLTDIKIQINDILLNIEEYSNEMHKEIVNVISELKKTDEIQMFDKIIYDYLLKEQNGITSLSPKICRNILLDYFKLSIENGDMSESQLKKIDISLYYEYISLKNEDEEFVTLSSFRKTMKINLKNLGDKKLRMFLNDAVAQEEFSKIHTVFSSYLREVINDENYLFEIKVGINKVDVDIISYHKEFNEEKKVIKTIFLALDFISENIVNIKNYLWLEMDQLNPSLHALSLNKIINVDENNVAVKKKL